jgi:isopenicillin N synthase-like dioxygenase
MAVDLPSTIPVVDLSPFSSSSDAEHRRKAAQDFTDACRRLGFVTVVGHGVSSERLAEAFSWSKKLFDLSHEDKMKAPHPPSNIPHRGYSPPGLEKVYSKAEREQEEVTKTGGKLLERVKDFKVRIPPPI